MNKPEVPNDATINTEEQAQNTTLAAPPTTTTNTDTPSETTAEAPVADTTAPTTTDTLPITTGDQQLPVEQPSGPAVEITEMGDEIQVTTDIGQMDLPEEELLARGLIDGEDAFSSDVSSLSGCDADDLNMSDASDDDDDDEDCEFLSDYKEMNTFIARMVAQTHDAPVGHSDGEEDEVMALDIPLVVDLKVDHDDDYIKGLVESNAAEQLPINKTPLYPGLQPLGHILNVFANKVLLQPYGLKNPLFTSSDDDDDDDDDDSTTSSDSDSSDGSDDESEFPKNTYIDKPYKAKVPSPQELSQLTTLQLTTPVYAVDGRGVGRLSDIMGSVLFPFFEVSYHNEKHIPQPPTAVVTDQSGQILITAPTPTTTQGDEEDDTVVVVDNNAAKNNNNNKKKQQQRNNQKKTKEDVASKIQFTPLPIPKVGLGDVLYILPSTAVRVPTKGLYDAKDMYDDGESGSTSSDEEGATPTTSNAQKQKNQTFGNPHNGNAPQGFGNFGYNQNGAGNNNNMRKNNEYTQNKKEYNNNNNNKNDRYNNNKSVDLTAPLDLTSFGGGFKTPGNTTKLETQQHQHQQQQPQQQPTQVAQHPDTAASLQQQQQVYSAATTQYSKNPYSAAPQGPTGDVVFGQHHQHHQHHQQPQQQTQQQTQQQQQTQPTPTFSTNPYSTPNAVPVGNVINSAVPMQQQQQQQQQQHMQQQQQQAPDLLKQQQQQLLTMYQSQLMQTQQFATQMIASGQPVPTEMMQTMQQQQQMVMQLMQMQSQALMSPVQPQQPQQPQQQPQQQQVQPQVITQQPIMHHQQQQQQQQQQAAPRTFNIPTNPYQGPVPQRRVPHMGSNAQPQQQYQQNPRQ